MSTLRTKLIAAGAAGAALAGGAGIATAASGLGGPSSGHTVNGKSETSLTGTVGQKVRDAALAKVPGTLDRVETNVDGSAPYEAHITKADGTEVEVQVNQDYSIAAVNAMGDHGSTP